MLILWLGRGTVRRSSFLYFRSLERNQFSRKSKPWIYFQSISNSRRTWEQIITSNRKTSWREKVRWPPRPFLGVSEPQSNPTACVLLLNLPTFVLSPTKVEFRDSAEMVASLAENRGNEKLVSPVTATFWSIAPIWRKDDRATLGTNVFACRWQRYFWQVSFICCLWRSCQQSWGSC